MGSNYSTDVANECKDGSDQTGTVDGQNEMVDGSEESSENRAKTNIEVHLPTPIGSIDVNPREDSKTITVEPVPLTGVSVTQNAEKSLTPSIQIKTPAKLGFASACISLDLKTLKVTVCTSAGAPGISVSKQKPVTDEVASVDEGKKDEDKEQ